MSEIVVDFSQFSDFVGKLAQVGQGAFKKDLTIFLDALGEEFLSIVQEEFIDRQRNTGYGRLLTSFNRDADGNIWKYEGDGVSLEVGTSINYAKYVNGGHYTSSDGKARFVPGYWQGTHFVYDPDAEGGMMLKFQWVEGLYFWDASLELIKELYPELLKARLNEWLRDYFG